MKKVALFWRQGRVDTDVIREKCKQESLHGSVRRTYEEMRGEKYYGTYTPVSAIPILHLRDLDLMQHVMGKQKVYLIGGWILLSYLEMNFLAVKDFNYFVDRTFNGYDLGRGTSYTDQIWKAQMLGLKGDKWREVRARVICVIIIIIILLYIIR